MTSEMLTTTHGAAELRRMMAYRRLAAAILGLDPATLSTDLERQRLARERARARRKQQEPAEVLS